MNELPIPARRSTRTNVDKKEEPNVMAMFSESSQSSSSHSPTTRRCPTDTERKLFETPKLKLKDAEALTKGDLLIKPESKLTYVFHILLVLVIASFILLFIIPAFGIVFAISLVALVVTYVVIKIDVKNKKKSRKPPTLTFPSN